MESPMSIAQRSKRSPGDAAGFVRGLGLFDGTMLVAGNMIGSGVFIVSADIARQVGSPGWLLAVWTIAGVLTLIAAVSYGELAAMYPRAGGQYIYLREAFGPMLAFLYGWALFLVIQTGTIAAVAIAFARFSGVLWPAISPTNLIFDLGVLPLPGIGDLSLSLSTQQLVAILATLLLTYINLRGLYAGRIIQDVFTVTKIGALLALIGLGLLFARNPESAIHQSDFWTPRINGEAIPPLALISIMGTAMVGALFAADAWNNVGFTGSEVKNPRRNIPLSMALGVGVVIALYLLANWVYLLALPMHAIQHAAEDRVAVAAAKIILGDYAELLMAIAIMISTFGCMNGMILAGARVYYSMAQDRLFFKRIGTLNRHHVPAVALTLQGLWIIALTMLRTYDSATETYSNLYSNLLDYIIFGVLIFYILTMAGIFVLRRTRPEIERPVRAWGYPYLTALYIVCAISICLVLLIAEKTRLNAGLGLLVVLTGLPVYWWWSKRTHRALLLHSTERNQT
ncbi:MAG: amino acid permease [Pseudomonadota bacterium]|nr:amino acid permease [Pseudomonadota bacterium]